MIVYAQTKARFVQDVQANRISRVVEQAFLQQLGFVPGQAELSAFQNSLNYVGNVLSDSIFDPDLGVAIEYKIPQTSKRIDVLLTGQNNAGKPTLIIIELKQWQDIEKTEMDAIVRTYLGGA